MKAQQIADRLESLLGHEINDWDKEELAEKLSRMNDRTRRIIMGHIKVIWPVSYALFLAFADRAEQALNCLEDEQFPEWVASLLDVYESEGLQRAVLFMENVEGAFLCKVRGEAGLLFQEVEQRLLPYVRGASGQQVHIASADKAYTDVTTIFLPKQITSFRSERQNFILYKLTASFLIGLDILGTFRLDQGPLYGGERHPLSGKKDPKDKSNPLDHFFLSFSEPEMAKELFYLVEAFRVMSWMSEEYPGLMRDSEEIFQHLFSSQERTLGSSPKSFFVEFLRLMVVSPFREDWKQFRHLLPKKFPEEILKKPVSGSVEQSLLKTEELYKNCEKLAGVYTVGEPLPFMGKLKCQKAYDGLKRRREEIKDTFVEVLSQVLIQREENKGAQEKEAEDSTEMKKKISTEQGTLLVFEPDYHQEQKEKREEENNPSVFLTIGSETIDLPEDAAQLALEIKHDLGAVPDEYISSAFGRAGGGKMPLAESSSEISGNEVQGPIVYDEWDYRRSGFRKNWCRLLEKEITPTKGTFFDTTLAKYKGQIVHLRKQFEAMVLQESFVRRQRDGNDIDLDAVIEALSDQRAGLAPSERLFVRLQRNERNIAALFLVDMSNSTEGWVGKALKESLILMCESLAVLGDRYAIYGFSGMRRTRSEFFTIKKFSDVYDDEVKGKISAVSPKEYTRMGPAIRHAAKILDGVEAKIRLLITLSDGKPEDYDDYKGVYAIEDTRHALIEAKSSGIHPFCITVDKQSHDYIAHMYGEVNYTFIDDVLKLPSRIPHIYRNLTT